MAIPRQAMTPLGSRCKWININISCNKIVSFLLNSNSTRLRHAKSYDVAASPISAGITTASRYTCANSHFILNNLCGVLCNRLHDVAISRRSKSTAKDKDGHENDYATSRRDSGQPAWNDEWEKIGLGAKIIHNSDDSNDDNMGAAPSQNPMMTNLLFVQTGFGIDQHGDRAKDGATKAAVRAVRNAIEFNSIPGMIEAVPGGRENMLIHVLLGVPLNQSDHASNEMESIMKVNLSHVAKVFPYGKLMPIELKQGGLSFPTGRIVRELGDEDDMAVCVAACVSIGYDSGERDTSSIPNTDTKSNIAHKRYDTRDGY